MLSRRCEWRSRMLDPTIKYCKEIEAAAEAMFVASSTNTDPRVTWREIRNFPAQRQSVGHYLGLASVALEAIDAVRDRGWHS